VVKPNMFDPLRHEASSSRREIGSNGGRPAGAEKFTAPQHASSYDTSRSHR
jgi:hypothetical protein